MTLPCLWPSFESPFCYWAKSSFKAFGVSFADRPKAKKVVLSKMHGSEKIVTK